MPNVLDVLLVVVFAVVLPMWSHFISWPRHVRAVDAGDLGARSRIYARTVVEEWALVAAAVTLFVIGRRSLTSLWLGGALDGRVWIGLAVPALYGALVLVQGRALAAKPAALARLRDKMQPLRALIPHTAGELRLFSLLSVTAGICEEFLFRGYLVWVLRSFVGLYPAAITSMVVFGLAHGYQGGKFGMRAFFVGVAHGVLALATRSLIPGMVLHAAIDLGSGWITYMAMSQGGEPVAAKVPNGAAA